MNWSLVPPVVAAIVAIVISVTHRITTVVVELSESIPSAGLFSMYVQGGRFASFVLVYGLLLGVAFRAGRRHDDEGDNRTMVLTSGVAAAFAYLVGTGVIVLLIGAQPESIVSVIAVFGSSIGVGIQLAVVTFAGAALAERV